MAAVSVKRSILVYIRWCSPRRHAVVWRNFGSRQHSTESNCFIHEELTRLFIVCETMFSICVSQTISHANGTEQQTQECRIQQLAVNPHRRRLVTETLLERKLRLKIQCEQRRRRRQQQTAE